jgi:hypothetical protein
MKDSDRLELEKGRRRSYHVDLFCFKSTLLGGLTRPMQDKREAKSCPRGLNHLLRPPPESPSPQSAVRKEKEEEREEKHTQSSPNLRERRLDVVQLITLLRTQRERERYKEILERCLDGILLIPPANFRILQEIQHRSCQSFILEQIHHLEPGPTHPPALPTLSSLPRDPLNPLFEGMALPLPRAASAKQMSTREI